MEEIWRKKLGEDGEYWEGMEEIWVKYGENMGEKIGEMPGKWMGKSNIISIYRLGNESGKKTTIISRMSLLKA